MKSDPHSNSPSKAAVYLYRYDKTPGQWSQILQSSNDTVNGDAIPQSRSAHQVAYNPHSGVFYMHGGKTGILIGAPLNESEANTHTNAENRLDDLWSMTLKRWVFSLESQIEPDHSVR